MQAIDTETGEVVDTPTALVRFEEMSAMAQTEYDLVQLSEALREYGMQQLEDQTNLGALKETRDKTSAIQDYFSKQIKSREARLEAQNNLAELRVRQERKIGDLIATMQANGDLASQAKGRPKASDDTRLISTLADYSISYDQSSRWQMLARFPEEMLEEYLAEAREKLWEITSAEVFQRAKKLLSNPSAVFSSESNEWYTPTRFIDAARQVMGAIDLDPASCEKANRTVKAARYFTAAEDGMAQQWSGRVWLNPPYGKEDNESNAARWSARLIEEYQAGNVEEAILLVNATTDREWFFPLWDFPICFTRGRIHFETNAPEAADSPVYGSAFVYMGKNPTAFATAFLRFGAVVINTLTGEANV